MAESAAVAAAAAAATAKGEEATTASGSRRRSSEWCGSPDAMRTTAAAAEAQGALAHALAGLTCFTLLPLFHFQLFFLLLESMGGNLSVACLAWVVVPSAVTRCVLHQTILVVALAVINYQ